MNRHLKVRPLVLISSIALVLACRDDNASERAATGQESHGPASPVADSAKPSTIPAADIVPNCAAGANPADTLDGLRSTEDAALACWSGRVRRAGDTLILTRVGHDEVRLIDERVDPDQPATYLFRGAVLRRYWVVDAHTYESGFTRLFDITGGEAVDFVSLPVAAPNGQYLATASRSLQIAEGATRLEIWHVKTGAPLLEFKLDPFNPAKPEEGWGPGDVTWRTADTLVVPRYRASENTEAGEVLQDTVRIVRTPTGWQIAQR